MKTSLSSERWEQVHRLFGEVVDVAPPARAARLDEACRDDPALREEVESLLVAYEQADDLLQVLDQIGGSSPAAPAQPSYTGTRVAHYEVLEMLGDGGMGVVYKALDTRLKRIVALKFLPPQWNQDDRAKQRFEHEARAASALDHPNICTIYEIGETQPSVAEPGQGQLFIAMAYYDGQTLKQKIKQGPLPLDEALDVATQIARGLAQAHTKDIVHRDIKPANVMIIDEGVVKVLDFGLAKMADVQMTKTGTMMGTVAYMSPEQTRGKGVDPRTDVWSLGVVLYEMLTGERPFKGDYDQAIIYSLLHENPARITALNPELPEEVEHMVEMCLEKEKDLRYPNVADLLADLEVLTQRTGPSMIDDALSGTGSHERSRVPRKAIVAGVALLVALLVLLVVMSGLGEPSLPDQLHLAVLPFTVAEADSTEQVFTDGLVETLRSRLIQLERFQNTLWVVPAGDMRRYPVTNPDEARQLFGANLAVSGHVERIEDRVRLTLALVDTETLREVRSSVIEGTQDNLSALQEDLVDTMTGLLELDLAPQIRRVLTAGGTTRPGAYDYYLRGRGYLQRYEQIDQIDAAIQLFDRARQEDPSYALAYAGLGEAYLHKYNLTKDRRWMDEAQKNCELSIEQNDDLAPVYVTLGLIDNETGQHGLARVMFNQALERDPLNAAAYRGLAKAQEELGEIVQAEEIYKNAISLKPDYWGGYNELGGFYHREGRRQEAIEQFQQVINLTPDNPLGYNNVGAQYHNLKQPQQAVQWYLESLAAQPTSRAYRNLGLIYYDEANYAEAAEMYEKARELEDLGYTNWGRLANAYYWMGQTEKARTAWQRMIELAEERLTVNPRSANVLGALAGAYSKVGGRQQQARAMIERLLDLRRLDNDDLYAIAKTYEQLGERDLALQYFEQALANGLPLLSIERSPWMKALRDDAKYNKMIEPYLEMRE